MRENHSDPSRNITLRRRAAWALWCACTRLGSLVTPYKMTLSNLEIDPILAAFPHEVIFETASGYTAGICRLGRLTQRKVSKLMNA